MIILLIILKRALDDTELLMVLSFRKILFMILRRYPLFYLRMWLENILGKAVRTREECFLLVSKLDIFIIGGGLFQLFNCSFSFFGTSQIPISFLISVNNLKYNLLHSFLWSSSFFLWIFSCFISSLVTDLYKHLLLCIYFSSLGNSHLFTVFFGVNCCCIESLAWVAAVSFQLILFAGFLVW